MKPCGGIYQLTSPLSKQDPYLEDQLSRYVGIGVKQVEEAHPFAASANPLMTMIAFLSSSVDPRGAFSCARSAPAGA